jgi:threonine dehydrogenase-like Zn-dependent dehydrogenase
MRKAVYHGVRDVRVEEVDEPRPEPDQVTVRVKYCGICGSDLHEYLHGPFPVSPFGHEVVGEVVEVGNNVDGFAPGDRVAVFNRDGYAEYQAAGVDQILSLPDDIEATLKDCLTSTRYQGTVVVQGIFTERVPIHMLGFVTQETTMIGCNCINPPLALEWLQTMDLAPESIVTSVIPLEDIKTRGFEALVTDKEKEIKILVAP